MFVEHELQKEFGIPLYPGHFPVAANIEIIIKPIFAEGLALKVVLVRLDLLPHTFKETDLPAVQHQVETGLCLLVNRLESTGKLINHLGAGNRVQDDNFLHLPGLDLDVISVRPLVMDLLFLKVKLQWNARKEPVVIETDPAQLPFGKEERCPFCLYGFITDGTSIDII